MTRHIHLGVTTFLVALTLLFGVAAGSVPKPSMIADKEGYGAYVNPTGDPIGGGEGYRRVVTSGDFTVTTAEELLDALHKAQSGQVIYVAADAEIDLTGHRQLRIPMGVTLAGNRGVNGAPGPLLYTDEFDTNPLFRAESGVRITGLRLRGPDPDTQSSAYVLPNSTAIVSIGMDVEVDNNEIFNWSYGGVAVNGGNAYIHHNYIHHVQRTGLGYPVVVNGAEALIEANYFDWYRHAIASSGVIGSRYEARYNVAGPRATSFAFDMHGGGDYCVKRSCTDTEKFMGGEWISIHHNTFMNSGQRAIGIRGVPLEGGEIYANHFVQTDPNYAIGFIYYIGNVAIYDNLYGSRNQRLVERQMERSPLVRECGSGWCNVNQPGLPLVAVVDPLKVDFAQPRFIGSTVTVQGRLPIETHVDVGNHMDVKTVEIFFGTERVYRGSTPPKPGEVVVDTRAFEDGTYPLVLALTDPRHGTLRIERRVRVSNWWDVVDGFQPPLQSGWFGQVDMSKTSETSAGWVYSTGDKEQFFGDEHRRIRQATTTEYLVWDTEPLREFKVTLYVDDSLYTAGKGWVQEALFKEGFRLEARSAESDWTPLDFGVRVEPASDGAGPWAKAEVTGSVPGEPHITQFRLTVDERIPAASLALGEVHLRGVYAGE